MESSISQVVYDKKVLESGITQLLVDFMQKYPNVKLGVDISFVECRDVTSKVVSTCVDTNVSVGL
jgi:hypothetical protein